MKNLLYVGVLILSMLFSCNRTEQKKTNNLVPKEDTIAIKVDTIIGSFHITYTIRDNDNVVSRQSITSKGDSILLEYADRSVFLDLICNGQTILSNQEINRQTFKSIIPKDEIEEFQLWFFGIKKVDDEGVLFNVNICIPDTDICYFIALHISKNGDFIVSQIEQDEDETDD